MTILKEKHQLNIEAADLLIKNSNFAPSIHCNYYSHFQYIKYILNQKFGISYDDQASKVEMTKGGSHIVIKNLFYEQLRSLNVKEKQITDFNKKHERLKSLRTRADYKNEKIGLRLAQKSEKLRIELINTIDNECK